jgi:hypothetical protein
MVVLVVTSSILQPVEDDMSIVTDMLSTVNATMVMTFFAIAAGCVVGYSLPRWLFKRYCNALEYQKLTDWEHNEKVDRFWKWMSIAAACLLIVSVVAIAFITNL